MRGAHKALSVRIPMLLDSLRQDATHREQGWSDALEQVADLVRVLCSETSAEFQHFYELLLARRLLRYRFISLPTERRVLELLPAMSKSAQMLHDIEQTEANMQRFKKYLLRRIDHHSIHYPVEMSDMTFNRSNCLNVHLLSGSVWPRRTCP